MFTIICMACVLTSFIVAFHLIYVREANVARFDIGELFKSLLLSVLVSAAVALACSFVLVLVSIVTGETSEEISHSEYIIENPQAELRRKSVTFTGTDEQGEPKKVKAGYSLVQVVNDPSLGNDVKVDSTVIQNPVTLLISRRDTIYIDQNNESVLNEYFKAFADEKRDDVDTSDGDEITP